MRLEPCWGTMHTYLQLAPNQPQLLTVAGDQSLGQREMEKAGLHKLTVQPQKKTETLGMLFTS